MRRFAMSVLTGAVVAVASTGRAQTGYAQTGRVQTPEQFRALGQSVEARRLRDSVPGVAIAVAKDGRVVWSAAYGSADLERRVPATTETPFAVGSLSKPLTATALMTFVQSREIELDRPANRYLDDAKIQAPFDNADAVTVRSLAGHASGISRHDLFYYANEPITPLSVDERIRRYAYAVRPIGVYEYSNLNYMMLAQIMSRVARQDFARVMQERLFGPLAMRHTSVGVPETGAELIATSYSSARRPVPLLEATMAGAGGAYASATDLASFGLFHLGHPPASGGPRVSAASLASMRRGIVATAPGNWYGLGWRIDSTTFAQTAILHTGSNGASASVIILIPSLDLCVVALANALTDLPGWVASEVVRAYGGTRVAATRAPVDSNGPFGTRAFRATTELTGAWRGSIVTYAGDVPMRLVFSDSGTIAVQLRDATPVRAGGVRWEMGFLRGSFDGDLGTSDARGRRYRMHFKLQHRGQALVGAVTAASSGDDPAITLSHYVRLQRP